MRTVKYETFSFGSATAWTGKVCLPATDDGSYHTLAENTQRYVTTTRFTPAGYTQIDTIWAYSLGGTTAGTQVISAINNGHDSQL
jgi:hypothetical protein